jgi:hypothetical protein
MRLRARRDAAGSRAGVVGCDLGLSGGEPAHLLEGGGELRLWPLSGRWSSPLERAHCSVRSRWRTAAFWRPNFMISGAGKPLQTKPPYAQLRLVAFCIYEAAVRDLRQSANTGLLVTCALWVLARHPPVAGRLTGVALPSRAAVSRAAVGAPSGGRAALTAGSRCRGSRRTGCRCGRSSGRRCRTPCAAAGAGRLPWGRCSCATGERRQSRSRSRWLR